MLVCIAFANTKLNFEISRNGFIAVIHHSATFHLAYTNQILDRTMVLINVELTCGPDGCRPCTAFHENGKLHVVSSTGLLENTNKLPETCVYITNASPKIWNL